MDERRTITRNGLICALIFSACFWAAWPVVEMGFNDDWSYIKSAQVFAQTGHIVYNGWATAMLGWQILWGGLFIRLFGFSFTVARLSTFAIAIITLPLFYAIQLRFGISPLNAVIGTLALGLSPLFIPLSASFMSDVPGVFVFLLCLYCCQRAIAAASNSATIAWLCFAAASNVVGGTVRQVEWLGVLVMVPVTGWLLRKRRGVLRVAILCWVAAIFSILYFMHWFASQPYSVPPTSPKPPSSGLAYQIMVASVGMFGAFLCLLLVLFPLLIAWLPRIRKDFGRVRFAIAIALFSWACIQWTTKWTLPWISNILRFEFASSRVGTLNPKDFPFMLGETASSILSLIVIAAFLAFVAAVYGEFRSQRISWERLSRSQIFWLLVPFTLGYCASLCLLSLNWWPFDRYLLGIMPVGIIFLILSYQRWVAPNLPAVSVITVALFGLLATAGTHDWFAWQRARLAAITELRTAGIPRAAIQGGFEYDAWTQISDAGYLNDPRIKVPPGAYHPAPDTLRLADGCKIAIDPRTPVVHPTYFVAFKPSPCLIPSKFGPVYFRAWLPPFRRAIYVKQLPALKR